MCRLQYSLLPCLVAGLFWMVPEANAQAPDENTGVIRITDSVHAANALLPEGPGVEGFSPDCAPGAPYGAVHGHGVSPHCPPGHCPPGHCRHGHCRIGHGHWGHGWGHGHWGHGPHHHHWSRTVHQILDWFNPYGMCTHSPDHGFCPPAKSPIFQADVVYQKMFPDEWTGKAVPPAAAVRPPVIYMPTDTTQLGYYYQKVPYWHPHPGMIPPPPVPSQWHVSLCDIHAPGPHPAGVIFGTAPRIAPLPAGPVPVVPTVDIPPVDALAIDPSPSRGTGQAASGDFLVPPAALVEPNQASGGNRLERSAGNPRLLPIDR